ncbi:hypothetical protein M513_05729 [Trichuris suis]|uniref:Uncharacterized protein n=1 Tax=Trichuris suis TaxID=68888 RepID=A0A085M8B9_9BILA|nr:hypothetical protein M513_05729 [Trichuris suis]
MALTNQDVVNGELSVPQIQRWLRENLPSQAELAKDLDGMEGRTFLLILKPLLKLITGRDLTAEIVPNWNSLWLQASDDKLIEAPTTMALIKFSDMILRRLGYSNGMKFSTVNQPSKRSIVAILSRLVLYCMFKKSRLPAYQQADQQLEETRNAYGKELEELDRLDEAISADEARLSAATKKCLQWKQELIEVDQSLPSMRTHANKLIHDSQMLEEELSALFEQIVRNAEILNEEGKEELDQLMAEMRPIDEANIDFEQLQIDIDALTSEQEQLSSMQLISGQCLERLNASLQSMAKIPAALDPTLEFAKASVELQNSVKEAELEISDLNKLNAQLIASKDERSKLVASREKARERLASASSKEAEQLKTEEMDLQTQLTKLDEEKNISKEAARRVENVKAQLRDLEETKRITIAKLENEMRTACSKVEALRDLVKQRNATIESNVQSMVQQVNTIRDELQEIIKSSYDNLS